MRAFRHKGEPWARFEVQPPQAKNCPFAQCAVPVRDHREIRSTSGHADMRFGMLLGRTALNGRVFVDPRRSFVTGKPPKN